MEDIVDLYELVLARITGKVITKPIEKRIINEFKRDELGEGRDYGLGFSILNKESEEIYKALMAFTACKDYLNDFIYVESTGKPLGSVYSFSHKYTGLLKDKEYFYTGFCPLHCLGKSIYSNFDKIKDILENNSKNIIKFLNLLEEKFKINNFSEFESYIEDKLIIKTPIFWSKFPFLYSMYGLLVRCFLDIKEEELKEDIFKVILNKKNTIISVDVSLLRSLQNYIPFDIDKVLDYKYPDIITPNYIHNFGIINRLGQIKK